ncbi:MAG: phnH [Paenibacillus sp.]|nr:phnH [Paenibacillus sp.]
MPNVKDMAPAYDRIHDTQYAYRELLDAFAKPGQIGDLSCVVAHQPELAPKLAMLSCFAHVLLDGEVTFSVAMRENREQIETAIRKLTFCRLSALAEADYVFADGDAGEAEIGPLAGELKLGSLIKPEDGATVFIRVDGFRGGEEGGCRLVLSGPGIPSTRSLSVQGLSGAWLELRARANEEYPLGIDIVLFEDNGRIAALPRTTVISGEWG